MTLVVGQLRRPTIDEVYPLYLDRRTGALKRVWGPPGYPRDTFLVTAIENGTAHLQRVLVGPDKHDPFHIRRAATMPDTQRYKRVTATVVARWELVEDTT